MNQSKFDLPIGDKDEMIRSTGYPKIETLFDRGEDFAVKPLNEDGTYNLRRDEFYNIKYWVITEKIDGMNVRVLLFPDGEVRHAGRTENTQWPPRMLRWLQDNMTGERVRKAFEEDPELGCKTGFYPMVVLYGEGYGPGIQGKAGVGYRKDMNFRLFDVWLNGIWLNWSAVEAIAKKLGIQTVPVLSNPEHYEQFYHGYPATNICLGRVLGTCGDQDGVSKVAFEENGGNLVKAEGIIARPQQTLLDRMGRRVMWKLKYVDFEPGKR